MANTALFGHRVMAVGQGVHAAAQQALQGAQLECVGPEALNEPFPRGRQPDLLVVDADAVATAVLTAWLDAAGKRPDAPVVIVSGSKLPITLMRTLLQLKNSDLLESPLSADDLGKAAARLLSPAVSHAPTASRCWSIMGAVGGSGATTLAVEACAAIAGLKPAPRVCLVDLNLVDGAAAAYLATQPSMRLSQIGSSDRIDAAVLSAFAAHTSDGFDLLAGPRDSKGFQATSADLVIKVLDVACQVYDWVIVDLPRHRQAWTLDVISGSDELLIISELTVPALLMARDLAADIHAEVPDGPSPRIVLNRVASRMFDPAPSLAEAERALGRTAEGGISSDWEAASAAVNLGGSIRQHRPRSKIVRDVANLMQRVASGPAAVAPTSERLAS